MAEEFSSPNSYSAMTPFETWIKALTQPKEEAYQSIVNDPGGSIGKAVLWLAGFGFAGGLITGIVNAIVGTNALQQFSQIFSEYSDIPFEAPVQTGGGFMAVVSGAFGGLFGAVIGAFIIIGLVQLVSKMLGGTGAFDKLFYGYAAYAAPLGLVTSVFSAIPVLGACLAPLFGIYGLVLAVFANKATHEYDTGKAVIAVLAPVLLVFILCCCVIFGFGALLAPVLQDFGSNFQY